MVFFGKIWLMNTVILVNFILKMTLVHAKIIPWRSNQEWRSICADTRNARDTYAAKIEFQLNPIAG